MIHNPVVPIEYVRTELGEEAMLEIISIFDTEQIEFTRSPSRVLASEYSHSTIEQNTPSRTFVAVSFDRRYIYQYDIDGYGEWRECAR